MLALLRSWPPSLGMLGFEDRALSTTFCSSCDVEPDRVDSWLFTASKRASARGVSFGQADRKSSEVGNFQALSVACVRWVLKAGGGPVEVSIPWHDLANEKCQ